MKRKVAIIVPSLRGGGAERVIVNVIRHLDQSKFDISLILINKEGPYVSMVPKNIPIINLKSDRVRNSLFSLVKVINELKPDVILSTLGHMNLALLTIKPFLNGNPQIIVRHANSPSQSLEKLSPIKYRAYLFLFRFLYKKSDVVLAQCKDMKSEIADLFRIKKCQIKYIYNPVDLKKINSEKKGENPYDKNKINLVAAGRLTYQKGFDLLLNAFKVVSQRYPNAHLTILGDGELKNKLVNLAKKLDIYSSISFVGFQSNPYRYYYHSDIYILSSRYEGFPNTLIEALACGVKVVSTNCKNGPIEILGNNKYGNLAKTEDSASLAHEIVNYLEGDNKTKDRANTFHIDKVIKEYEELLLQEK